MRSLFWAVAFVGFVAAVTYPASGGQQCCLVANFDQADQNALGGRWNAYQAGTSRAAVERVEEPRHGEAGHCLRIRSQRQSQGFCGVWMHFFDVDHQPHRFFDAEPYNFLSFWIKGHLGGERFSIKIADQKWIAKQDSICVGHINDFLPGGVTTSWQEVLIPLRTSDRLDWQQLGGLTLDFESPGTAVIYVDDVSFKTSPAAESPAEPVAAAPPAAVKLIPTPIVQPRSGESVARVADVVGKLSLKEHAIVLVQSAEPNSLWWVQGPMQRIENDQIVIQAHFGNDKTLPGTRFHMVLLTSQDADLLKGFQTGDSLKDLPRNLPASKAVTVVRK